MDGAAHHSCRLKIKPGATEAEMDSLLREQIVLQPVKELMKYQLVASDEDNYRCTDCHSVLLCCCDWQRMWWCWYAAHVCDILIVLRKFPSNDCAVFPWMYSATASLPLLLAS
jgi:hypothetical protein